MFSSAALASAWEIVVGDLETASTLINQFIPVNTWLSIEPNIASFGERYIYRLHYTSPNSGRTMAVVAKSDNLPLEECEQMRFILRQLVLTPKEISIEFARILWKEKNARQLMWNSGEFGNIRVSEIGSESDRAKGFGSLQG